MRKSSFIIIAAILLLAVAARADYKETLYDDYVHSGYSTLIQNTTFFVSFSGTEKIAVYINDTGIVLSKGICEKKGNYEICFDGTNFSYQNYTTDKDIYKAKIRIYEFLAYIEAKREATKSSILIGEDVTITTTLKNLGSVAATNITYVESIPDGFVLTENTGCFLSISSLYFTEDIPMNDEKVCKYTIKAEKNATYLLKATLSYFDGKKTVAPSLSELTVKVPSLPITLEINFSRLPTRLNELFTEYITLTNIDTENTVKILSFVTEVPEGLKPIGVPPRFKLDYLKYLWSGALEPTESTSFSLEFKTEKYADYNFMVDIVYLIKDKRHEATFSNQVTLSDPLALPKTIQPEEQKPVEQVQEDDTGIAESATNQTTGISESLPEFSDKNASVNTTERKEFAPVNKSRYSIPKLVLSIIIIITTAILAIIIIRKSRDIREGFAALRKNLQKETKKGLPEKSILDEIEEMSVVRNKQRVVKEEVKMTGQSKINNKTEFANENIIRTGYEAQNRKKLSESKDTDNEDDSKEEKKEAKQENKPTIREKASEKANEPNIEPEDEEFRF